MMFNLCMNSVNILSVFRIVKCDVQFMSEQDELNIFSVFRIASEDVGLGDPSALPLAVAAFQVGNWGKSTFQVGN